jgi:hypothetical protein
MVPFLCEEIGGEPPVLEQGMTSLRARLIVFPEFHGDGPG